MYYDEVIYKSKNKTKTTWKIIKKEIGNNHQNGIRFLKINNTITNNPQKIVNTFNEPRDNVNPSSYLSNNFNSTFPRIN